MSGITHLVDIMKIPRFVRVKQYFPHNELSEDDLKDAEKDVQELTDKYVKLIDKAVKEKEQEVMSL